MNTTAQENPKAIQETTQQTAYVSPYVDIESTESGYILRAEMPGVNREGIQVTIEDGDLVLVGHRQPLAVSGQPIHRESRQLSFRRVYELDPSIDAAKISAKIELGILTVNLPKADNLKPRRIELE